MIEHRILSVRQPWAWCIFHGKGTENRTHKTGFLGRLWIHAGAGWSRRGENDPRVLEAWNAGSSRRMGMPTSTPWAYGFRLSAIVGSVDLVDCHPDSGCCRPWGESHYVDAAGTSRTDLWHWVFEKPQELRHAVDAKGRLGIWRPDPDLSARLDELVAA